MDYKTYIKEGDGNRVYINRKGMQLFNEFLGKNGGGVGVAEMTKMSERTISSFKNNAYCHPTTWETLFTAIQSQLQPAA